MAGWVAGWVAGEIKNIAISSFNHVEVEVEYELGKKRKLPLKCKILNFLYSHLFFEVANLYSFYLL